MDISTISSAVASLKTAKEILQGMLQLSNMAEVQGRVIDLQSVILDAQGKALETQASILLLYQRISVAEDRVEELSSHRDFVATLTRHDGAYLAPNDSDPFCPRCIEASTTPIHLVKTSRQELRIWVWACPQCNMQLPWRRPSDP